MRCLSLVKEFSKLGYLTKLYVELDNKSIVPSHGVHSANWKILLHSKLKMEFQSALGLIIDSFQAKYQKVDELVRINPKIAFIDDWTRRKYKKGIVIDWTIGAEVPFMRPAELSSDYAGTLEVMAHATQWALDQNLDLEAVCCIYATAPFIQVTDLQNGLNAIRSGDWAYSFAATDFGVPIFRSFKKSSGGGVEMFFPEDYDKRSQDLPIALHDAGQFYWGRPEAWIKKFKVFEKHSVPLIIPRWRAQDIDTKEDWVRAEILAPAIMSTEH
jgi:N-acylneuraminate cytidylyltransferase